MKGLKKKMAALTAAALCLTSMPLDGVQIVSAATSVDSTVKLKPTEASIFNDTNGDGLGEFEGWELPFAGGQTESVTATN